MAAISIVAYNNVQRNARDNIRYSDAKTIMKAVEMYKIQSSDGRPPQYPASVNMGVLNPVLKAGGITSDMPDDSKYPYYYAGSNQNYAIRIYKESIGGYCKVSFGSTVGWYGTSVSEC